MMREHLTYEKLVQGQNCEFITEGPGGRPPELPRSFLTNENFGQYGFSISRFQRDKDGIESLRALL